jgi:hypothetical protein
MRLPYKCFEGGSGGGFFLRRFIRSTIAIAMTPGADRTAIITKIMMRSGPPRLGRIAGLISEVFYSLL